MPYSGHLKPFQHVCVEPDPTPERVISGHCSRLKIWRSFFWMTEILWKSKFHWKIKNFATYYNPKQFRYIININPQTSNRLVAYILFSGFYTWLSKVKIIIFFVLPSSKTLRPLAQKSCAPLPYRTHIIYSYMESVQSPYGSHLMSSKCWQSILWRSIYCFWVCTSSASI